MEVERVLIAQERTLAPDGYNLVSGGLGVFSPSEETRTKMSAARLRPEARRRIVAAAKRRRWTREQRAMLSRAHLGKKLSPETIAKLTAAKTGQKRTLAQRMRMSVAQRRRFASIRPSAESRRRMSLAHLGKPWSAAQRKAGGNSGMKFGPIPESRRLKIAAARRREWSNPESRAKRLAAIAAAKARRAASRPL
jgi:hypothetical protein